MKKSFIKTNLDEGYSLKQMEESFLEFGYTKDEVSKLVNDYKESERNKKRFISDNMIIYVLIFLVVSVLSTGTTLISCIMLQEHAPQMYTGMTTSELERQSVQTKAELCVNNAPIIDASDCHTTLNAGDVYRCIIFVNDKNEENENIEFIFSENSSFLETEKKDNHSYEISFTSRYPEDLGSERSTSKRHDIELKVSDQSGCTNENTTHVLSILIVKACNVKQAPELHGIEDSYSITTRNTLEIFINATDEDFEDKITISVKETSYTSDTPFGRHMDFDERKNTLKISPSRDNAGLHTIRIEAIDDSGCEDNKAIKEFEVNVIKSSDEPEPEKPKSNIIFNDNITDITIRKRLSPGESDDEYIDIRNNGETDLQIKIKPDHVIERFVIIDPDIFDLVQNESRRMHFKFLVGEYEMPGVYVGKIRVEAGNINKTINVIIEVREKILSFDISVDVIKKEVLHNEAAAANISVINLMNYSSDAILYYAIKDFNDTILIENSENITITNKTYFARSFEMLEIYECKEYIFYAKVFKDNISASGADIFKIICKGSEPKPEPKPEPEQPTSKDILLRQLAIIIIELVVLLLIIIQLLVLINKKMKKFIVSKNKIKTIQKRGESKKETFTIKNIGQAKIYITIDPDFTLRRFLIFKKMNFSLEPGKSKKIEFDIAVRDNEPPEAVFGILKIKSGTMHTQIDMVIEIKGKISQFDIKTTAVEHVYEKKAKAIVEVKNLSKKKRIVVYIYYAIKDYRGKVIISRQEVKIVDDKIEIIKELAIPEKTPYGDYIFYTKAYQREITAASSDLFTSMPPSKKQKERKNKKAGTKKSNKKK